MPATIEVLDPISDGSNGAPRLDFETRPVNMSVVWVITVTPVLPVPALGHPGFVVLVAMMLLGSLLLTGRLRRRPGRPR